MKEDICGHVCGLMERTVRTWKRRHSVEFFVTPFRNLSVVGGSVWRVVVIHGEVCGEWC
jgi:hypothetical protein